MSTKLGDIDPKKREIIRRIESGESQVAIARELGRSRQLISRMWLDYKEMGDEALVIKKKGAKKAVPLSKLQAKYCKEAVANKKPSDFGIDDEEAWTAAALQKLVSQKYGFHLRVTFAERNLHGWGFPPPRDDAEDLDPEFIAYMNSPLAKQIAEREKANRERIEAMGGFKKRKRGRPRKKKEGEDEPGAPRDDSLDDDDDDLSLPSVGEMTEINKATLKEFGKNIAPTYDFGPANAGQRTGKHAKGSTAKKQKRRKKGKKGRK